MAKIRESFLPFALPDINDDELKELKEVLASGWLTTGPKTHALEQAFCEYLHVGYAVAVNSCTAAMHLALEAIGLQRGDIVLTSPYTFAATAEVIRYFSAIPVFVDIEPDTLNIHPELLEETIADVRRFLIDRDPPQTIAVRRALTNINSSEVRDLGSVTQTPTANLRAIMPVHMAGHPCEMDKIYKIASQNNLAIVEDAAHALPAAYNGLRIGGSLSAPGQMSTSPSVLTCFSFYVTKSMTTGEGGMITTDDEGLADRCSIMSLHGISKDAWKRYTAEGSWYYEIIAPGYKYNMTDLAAALGLAQFRKIDKMLNRRKQIAQLYTEAFSKFSELEIPTVRNGIDHAWHLYILRLNPKNLKALSNDTASALRNEFIEELRLRNIGTSVHFIPLHLHPYYRHTFSYLPEDFPVAYSEYKRALSLPIYSRMNDQDVKDVIAAVSEIVAKFRR